MLSYKVHGESPRTLFFLHFLGSSSFEWEDIFGRLSGEHTCIGIDLPGFGSSAGIEGYSVAEMAEACSEVIRHVGAARWYLVGHSMGAKVALALAGRIAAAPDWMPGLAGLITVAGSPPGPEPIGDERRQAMLGWFKGDEACRHSEAADFIRANTGIELKEDCVRDIASDAIRMAPQAWRAWLEHGSREDISSQLGALEIPALVIAGERDADLGEDAQRRLMLPHLNNGRIEIIEGAGHLMPLETPQRLADLIASEIRDWSDMAKRGSVEDTLLALERANRVSRQTKDVLLARAEPGETPYRPAALSAGHFALLRIVARRLVPHDESGGIDLAATIDRSLASGKGDGWRHDTLPADRAAYAAGLATLEAAAFFEVDAERQSELLREALAGALDPLGRDPAATLDAAAMKLWSGDVLADCTRAYVSHPATMLRIGYDGFANGGDAFPMTGFTAIGPGEREPWELDPETPVSP